MDIATAKQILAEEMTRELWEDLTTLDAEGVAVWTFDPEVEGVIGLVQRAEPNRAIVVVYPGVGSVGLDFEVDEDLVRRMLAELDED